MLFFAVSGLLQLHAGDNDWEDKRQDKTLCSVVREFSPFSILCSASTLCPSYQQLLCWPPPCCSVLARRESSMGLEPVQVNTAGNIQRTSHMKRISKKCMLHHRYFSVLCELWNHAGIYCCVFINSAFKDCFRTIILQILVLSHVCIIHLGSTWSATVMLWSEIFLIVTPQVPVLSLFWHASLSNKYWYCSLKSK